MIKLKLIGKSKIESLEVYLQLIKQKYEDKISGYKTDSDNLLIHLAYLELVENMLKKVRIAKINQKAKLTLSILKIEALQRIHNNNKMFENDIYKKAEILHITSSLNKQLLN